MGGVVAAGSKSSIDETRLRLAAAERAAAERAHNGHAPDAAATLQKALDTYLPRQRVKSDPLLSRTRAYYLQALASYQHESDPGGALELQHAAHDIDRELLRPTTSKVKRKTSAPAFAQPAAAILKFYGSFQNPNAFLAQLETLKVGLSFETEPHLFEHSLKELAAYVGADGARPEHEQGEGPDGLFSWPAMHLVIEAKNERTLDSIPKKDAEQLLHSMQWFGDNYPLLKPTAIPIMVARAIRCGTGVHLPADTRIITSDTLEAMLDAITKFALRISEKLPGEWTVAAISTLLNDHRLVPERLVPAFTVKPK